MRGAKGGKEWGVLVRLADPRHGAAAAAFDRLPALFVDSFIEWL